MSQFLSTFKEYPPRQAPASFSVAKVLEELTRANAAPAEDGPRG